MMKTYAQTKARGPAKVNTQQVIFELKNKVVLALNKLADRDTYQIAVDELEKTAGCLSPDGIAPFLSCILDTDSEQKSAVRKECIRLMGTVTRFHEGLVNPHLAKMVASIVKRLKDQDSVVRDACVETVGILSSKLGNCGGDSDGVFVVLVKPLFESLGEQNKQVQMGSALCLARIIDNTQDPPVSILQRMLTRTIKLLKNPHFMAKPAVIELNRSIIQAGGATTQNILSAAMISIQEALKNSNWTTRKAASAALGEIASGGGSFLGSFKASCIRFLESCRFDKVKPVRDSVLQALHYWRTVPGSDTPEPSEAGSSIKGDYGDITSASDSGQKDVTLTKVGTNASKKRVPLSVRKSCQNYVEIPQHSKPDDWHVEIAVPKIQNGSLADCHNEESEGSSVTKTFENMSADVTSALDIGYEYVPMDEKQESSVSNLVDDFETKFVTVSSHGCLEDGSLLKSKGKDQQFAVGEINRHTQTYSKMQDRRSLDSTVTTNSSSQTMRGCCLETAREMVCIRKQLLEIENKQSNLMDLLQVFTTSTVDSLSMIQSKMLSLEHVVDRLAQDLVRGGRHSDLGSSKLMKSQNGASPRISTCTPRPSVDIHNRQPSLLPIKTFENWEEKESGRSRLSNSAKQDLDLWTNSRNPAGKDIQKSSRQGAQSMVSGLMRKNDAVFASAARANARQDSSENTNSLWKRVKGFLCEGDIDSAYVEALCSSNELLLVELLNRTGPVLESLSHQTVSDVLSTLASYFLEQRFMNSIIPWLQQVVDLSTIRGPNYLLPSAKSRREFLCAIQETVNMDFSNLAERRSITQLAMKLHQIWGKCS